MQTAKGFTLIELTIVVVILGILAVFAAPRFLASGFDVIAARDQLQADLRLVQLQNLNSSLHRADANNACYWLVVQDECAYAQHSSATAGSCNAPTTFACNALPNNITASRFNRAKVTTPQGRYLFDRQGRLDGQSSCSQNCSLNLAGLSQLTVSGSEQKAITINVQGYIDAP